VVTAETAQKFDAASYNALLAFVENNTPQSPKYTNYGMTDAVEYYNWVTAYANIKAALAPDAATASQATVIQIFTQPNQNPINLIALLSSPDQDLLVSAARAGNTDVANAMQRAQAFLEGYQGVSSVHGFYEVLDPVFHYKK
jgi:hypothetical protein